MAGPLFVSSPARATTAVELPHTEQQHEADKRNKIGIQPLVRPASHGELTHSRRSASSA